MVRLYGIEIVDERRQVALRKGILRKTGDLNEPFPFGDEQFDIVHANQVIEHLKDTDISSKRSGGPSSRAATR